MAKRKHKRRANREVAFALIFAAVFIVAVAIMIPVMVQYSEKEYADKLAQEEAERQYRMDLSWIDSDINLAWLAGQSISELDEEGEWNYTDGDILLRSYNFADDVIEDIPIEIENLGNLMLVPSDDPRGYVLAGEEKNAWSIYRLDENDRLIPVFFEVNSDIKEIIGFYEGKLYCHVYGEDEDDPRFWDPDQDHLVCWDSKTKEVFRYRDAAIALNPDGSAVMLDERSTGLFRTYFSHYDENGKPVEKQWEIEGWMLGIEDAQGNWRPMIKIGEDGSFMDVSCAVWLDDDRMLFAAGQQHVEGSYSLYLCTFSRGKVSLFCDQTGEAIYLYEEPVDGSMSVSPDGRFIAYQVIVNDFKVEGDAILIVQSLETGRYAQVCPQEPEINEDKKVSVSVLGDLCNQIWIQ